MRIDPDTCRDPDLLAAEVRRLQGVIAAGKAAITDEEREAIRFASVLYERGGREDCAATLRGLLERAPQAYRKTAAKRPIEDMSGENARGSHREPCAWAVVLADGQRIYDVYGIEEEAKAIDEAVTGNHRIVPLYRLPALTDEQREALERAVAFCECTNAPLPTSDQIATLRVMLERIG